MKLQCIYANQKTTIAGDFLYIILYFVPFKPSFRLANCFRTLQLLSIMTSYESHNIDAQFYFRQKIKLSFRKAKGVSN